MKSMQKFLEGELIDLYIPNLDFIKSKKNTTYKWWNDHKVTNLLESGTQKNTRERQLEYYSKTKDIVFFISDKVDIIGTVMIADINQQKKTGELGYVRGVYKNEKPLQTIEAIAHVMDYGFKQFNLERIFAKHHIEHIPFSHILSLLGYKLEGIFRNDFIKENWSQVNDRIHTACHRKDYEYIISLRGGGALGQSEKYAQKS